jgi:hypothetical protein
MPGCMLDGAGEGGLKQFGAYDKPCEALVTALVVSAARARDALVARLELELELEVAEKAA